MQLVESSTADVLAGSSFAFNPGSGTSGSGAVWGHGAVSRIDGQQDGTSFDGEVTTGLAGADWMLGRGIAGVLLSHARGTGGYRSDRSAGELESTLTGAYPWACVAVNDRVTLTGVAGHGTGTLRLAPEGALPIETDTALSMAALDLRGVLITPSADAGMELTSSADVLLVQTEMRQSENDAGALMASEAGVTRLRVGLEGSWHGLEIGGGRFVPRVEIGVRHDGGDAEQGYGTDLGAGLDWTNAQRGIEAQLRVRGLLTHEDKGFTEHGVSLSLIWDPVRDSELGPAFSLHRSTGGSATGGMDALLGADAASIWRSAAPHDALSDRRKLQARLGYGLSLFGGRYIGVPELGLGRFGDERELGVGWRMLQSPTGGRSFSFGLQGARLDGARDGGGPGHRVGLDLSWRLAGIDPAERRFDLTVEGSRNVLQRREPESRIDIGFSGRW